MMSSAEIQWGGPPGPRGSPRTRSSFGINFLPNARGRPGGRPRTRRSTPQFMQVFGGGKTKRHWAIQPADRFQRVQPAKSRLAGKIARPTELASMAGKSRYQAGRAQALRLRPAGAK